MENDIIDNVHEYSDLKEMVNPLDPDSPYEYVVNNFWSGVETPHSVKLVDNTVLNTNYHEIENYMYAAHQLGHKGEVPGQWVGKWKWRGSLTGERKIGIHSGCFGGAWAKKKWDKFNELAIIISKDFNVYNFGQSTEKLKIKDGEKWLPSGIVVDHANDEYSLSKTIDLMCEMDYFIGNDSGLMHIADALGIPTIAIFGPTLVVKNRPVGKNSMTIQASSANYKLDSVKRGDTYGCIPCQYTPNFNQCEDNVCLKNISAEFVYEEFVKLRAELSEKK